MAYVIHTESGQIVARARSRAQIIKAVYEHKLGAWNCKIPNLPRYGKTILVAELGYPSFLITNQ